MCQVFDTLSAYFQVPNFILIIYCCVTNFSKLKTAINKPPFWFGLWFGLGVRTSGNVWLDESLILYINRDHSLVLLRLVEAVGSTMAVSLSWLGISLYISLSKCQFGFPHNMMNHTFSMEASLKYHSKPLEKKSQYIFLPWPHRSRCITSNTLYCSQENHRTNTDLRVKDQKRL